MPKKERGAITGAQLMWLRTRAGLSREDLGRELGVAYMTVYRWERGLLPISRVVELAIRHILKRPPPVV